MAVLTAVTFFVVCGFVCGHFVRGKRRYRDPAAAKAAAGKAQRRHGGIYWTERS